MSIVQHQSFIQPAEILNEHYERQIAWLLNEKEAVKTLDVDDKVKVKLEYQEPNLAVVGDDESMPMPLIITADETKSSISVDHDEKDPNNWPAVDSAQPSNDEPPVKEEATEEAIDHKEIEDESTHSSLLNAKKACNDDILVKAAEELTIQEKVDALLESLIHHIPKKRRVEVLVPTMDEVKKKEKERLEDLKKLKAMKNPVVKKRANMELKPDTLRTRLIPIGLNLFDITLDKPSQDVKVTRQFMSKTFGGSEQGIFPPIAKKFFDIHGMNDFMYLNPDFQPEAPEVPGAPGLYFNLQKGEDFTQIMRVLTRINVGIWQYMGMYEVKRSERPALTRAEWFAQSSKFRKTWADEICHKDWGRCVRIRIVGRRVFGREPTRQEYDLTETSNAWKHVTPEEIEQAYDEGKEKIGVWTMKCVAYDNAFQRQLCDKYPTFVPRPRRPKQLKGSKARKEKKPSVKIEIAPNSGNPTTRSTGKKRKHSETHESESEEDSKNSESDSGSSDLEEPDESHLYRNRGTRSRPIVFQ